MAVGTAMKGKVVVVTGATSGIGRATAFFLAAMGATVVLACRNLEKADAVRDLIAKRTENPDVSALKLDLASLASVRTCALQIKGQVSQLDVLVNNAGVFSTTRQETEDGFELTMGTNHLGHFLLTLLVLPVLEVAPQGRIVNVASEAAFYGKIDLDDLQMTASYGMMGFNAYAASKLANVLFTQELAERLGDSAVTVNAVHPGGVNTNIWPNDKWYWRAFNWVQSKFRRSSKEGSRTVVHAATSPDLRRVTGSFLADQEVKSVRGACLDRELQKGLWAASMRLTDAPPVR